MHVCLLDDDAHATTVTAVTESSKGKSCVVAAPSIMQEASPNCADNAQSTTNPASAAADPRQDIEELMQCMASPPQLLDKAEIETPECQ